MDLTDLTDLTDPDPMDTALRASTTGTRGRICLNTKDMATIPKTGHTLPLLLPMDDLASLTRLLSASVHRHLRCTVATTHLLTPMNMPLRHPQALVPLLLITENTHHLPPKEMPMRHPRASAHLTTANTRLLPHPLSSTLRSLI